MTISKKLIKINLIFTIVMTFILFLTLFFIIINSYKRQKKQFINFIRNDINVLSQGTSFSNYFEYNSFNLKNEAKVSLDQIKDTLKRFINTKKNIDIIKIIFIDRTNNVITSINNNSFKINKKNIKIDDSYLISLSKDNFNKNFFLRENGNFLIFYKKLNYFNQNGFLIIITNNSFYDYYKKLTSFIIFLFLFSIISGKFLYNFLYKTVKDISIPIMTIEKTAKEISSGKYLKKIEFTSNFEELNSLIQSFNKMIETIQNDIQYIKTTNSLLDNIIQNTPNAIVVIDSNGHVLRTNYPANNIFGNLEYNKNINIFKNNKNFNNYQSLFFEVLHTKRKAFLPEEKIQLNGKNKEFEVQIYPLKSNGISGGVFIFRDKSIQNKYRDQLIIANKMEAVGRFASQIVHDFNNILGIIALNIKLLFAKLHIESEIQFNTNLNNKNNKNITIGKRKYEEYFSKNLSEIYEIKEITELLEKTIKKGKNLTSDLLSFIRKEKTQNKIKIDIGKSIQNNLNTMKNFFLKKKNIKVVNNISPSKYFIYFSENHFTQIFTNLLLNAIDAVEVNNKKEKIIIISCYSETVDEIEARQNIELEKGKYIILSIKDNGCGIEPSIREKIFDPLFTTKKEGKGTGLGLSIVYDIVRSNRGMIFVDSEPSKGTEFKIYFKTN